jgi:hypothetical protein
MAYYKNKAIDELNKQLTRRTLMQVLITSFIRGLFIGAILAVILVLFTGCGKGPKANSVLCFLNKGFVSCQDKEIQAMIPEPINGVDGQDGTNGQDGADGKDGVDGKDGSEVLVVFPCGEDSVRHAEILLLIGGQYIAYFQNIVKQGQPVVDVEARLTVLEENTLYMLTDGSKCKFSIIDGEIVSQ